MSERGDCRTAPATPGLLKSDMVALVKKAIRILLLDWNMKNTLQDADQIHLYLLETAQFATLHSVHSCQGKPGTPMEK